MQISERSAKSVTEHAATVLARGRGLFQSKETRDEVYARIRNEHPRLNITRHVVRSQNLHPEYVTDYVGRLETGFGNTQYQTYWSRLYDISVNR